MDCASGAASKAAIAENAPDHDAVEKVAKLGGKQNTAKEKRPKMQAMPTNMGHEPKKKKAVQKTAQNEKIDTHSLETFVYTTVRAGETFRSVARKYSVPPYVIQDLNEWEGERMPAGTICEKGTELHVPVKDSTKAQVCRVLITLMCICTAKDNFVLPLNIKNDDDKPDDFCRMHGVG